MYIQLIIILAATINGSNCDIAPLKRYYRPIPIRDVLNNGRIISGSNAITGQFPWQVSIEARKPGFVSYCGGSLITSNAVLTAGHCCQDYMTFTINLGSIYKSSPLLTRNVDSSKVVFHPRFNNENLNYDAAIIKLVQDVQFSNTIQRIVLPHWSHAVQDMFYDSIITVSGWGRTESGELATQLQYGNMTVIKNIDCKLFFGNPSIVIESTICAKDLRYGKISPCSGDSGGPAVMFYNNRWILLGIISFTTGPSCQDSFLAGFVNVSFLLTWISNTTGLPIEYFI